MSVRDGYKITEVGVIPEEWEAKSLGSLFKLSSGSFLSQKDIEVGNYPVYGGNGINGYHNEYMFESPQIVIGRVGAKCGCIHVTQPFSWITDNALYISNKLQRYSDNFLSRLLFSLNLNIYANQNAQPVISGSKIYPIFVPFPPLPEQQKIAEILSTVDVHIYETEALINKTQVLKKGMMQRLLTKGIGHTEFKDTEIGWIPVEWEVVRLGDVTIINRESLSASTDPDFAINYIDIESVTTGKINKVKTIKFIEAPSRARRRVIVGDTIISTVRPYLKAFAFIEDIGTGNLICSTGFAVITPEKIEPRFVYQYILSDAYVNQLVEKMSGSNYPAVNSSDVGLSMLPFPQAEEQSEIASILSKIDDQIAVHQSKLTSMTKLKSALMQQLLTGKIRVMV